MAKKKRSKKTQSKLKDDSKLFAFIAAFLSIVGFFIALLVKKDDKYVMHYAKQSLMVFIVFVVAWAVMIVPIIGWIVGPIVYLVGVILWLFSWIYALTGEMKIVPIVGEYSNKIDL